jgi:hypothetical protein
VAVRRASGALIVRLLGCRSGMGSAKDIEFSAVVDRDGTISCEYDSEDAATVLPVIRKLHADPPKQDFDAKSIAGEIARALAPQLRKILRPVGVPPDDAFVDQDAGLFGREVYLRLARRGKFPNQKVGNKRVARWADVKAAFIGAGNQVTVVEPTDNPEADLLNEVRQRAGLQIK